MSYDPACEGRGKKGVLNVDGMLSVCSKCAKVASLEHLPPRALE